MLKDLLKSVEKYPRKLFLLDALGAFVTAIMLGVVLVRLESMFGIPPSALHLLAIIPITYVIYDLLAYSFGRNKIGLLLRGIAFLNLTYCCISIGVAISHADLITYLGWLYIIGEISIIVILSIYELNVAKKLK